ncbi:Crp/Fnr family transcriptional regulator [Polaromonas sp.]|uniref:Crp/Fnr family transcriptional regulator n=1 Tax=Polaromonas sp. TaxID=1869339 RepID=UPI0017980710|nr:Crp/Fnr family transcriptional regulator [Polaromonas sp.]NML84643.1 Crp/Fnr family transcriptional regulator [Polaromonas sp.]
MSISPSTSKNCPPLCADCRLRQTSAFTPVKAQEMAFIASFRTGTSTAPAGGTLIREQNPRGKLFTLYSGWAFRYKTLSDGRRQILNFLLPGDLIGLQQEFSDGAMHGIEAVTDVSLCEFPREGLWELYRQHPGLGYDITWLAAREEGMVDDNLLTAGRRNAIERIAMLLMHLYRRLERLGLAKGGSVEFPINQQHIADTLGLSLVHTNKTLRRLTQLGMHEIRNGRLFLLNPKALQRLAEYYDLPPKKVPLL